MVSIFGYELVLPSWLSFLSGNVGSLLGTLVVLGCGVFILAFILRDVLYNLFCGVALLLDKPFQLDDVVKMEDGSIVVVKGIGLRVTHLYNVDDHSEIFIPNNNFANQRLVNITRPNPDLTASSTVDNDCDIEK